MPVGEAFLGIAARRPDLAFPCSLALSVPKDQMRMCKGFPALKALSTYGRRPLAGRD